MTAPPDTAFADRPLTLLRRVNGLCNRFEADWQSGRRPRLEDYLAGVDAGDRLVVLRQLLPLDADYRRARGEAPAADDYLARFPDLDPAWLTAALAETLCQAGGPADTPAPPALGGYELLNRIGSGGMGTVYRARHRRMGRDVALKVLAGPAAGIPDCVRRFWREVETAAKLAHPNLVTAYDAGEDQGVPYLVSEFIDGTDLARLVWRDGPLPIATALEYVLQAARGLAHAHAQGVVHRDVKPANLLVDRRGVVRVLDVGLARLVRGAGEAPPTSTPAATAPGILLGTVDYMAPEQARDPARADGRADVYGLGCTLHYLLTGRPVFGGADVWEQLLAHRERPVPSLRCARADAPASLDRVFRKMLAKDPARRHRSMGEVIHDLDVCRGGAPRPRGLRRLAGAALLGLVVVAGGGPWHRGGAPADDPPAIRADGEAVPLAEVPFADPADYQRRWAGQVNRPVAVTNDLGMRLVLIPPGRFQMGSPEEEIRALLATEGNPGLRECLRGEARHAVAIDRAFYLGSAEVTVGQFRAFVHETGHRTHVERFGTGYGLVARKWVRGPEYHWDAAGDQPLTDDHAVLNVNWHDAVAFCEWLTGRSPTGLLYRLPTEAEWEYACRAGRDTPWCFGDNPAELGRYAWFAGNARGVIHPVGQKRPNAFGLYDMHGNRAEWCGNLSPDPRAPNEERRPLRGGRYNGSPRSLRCAARDWEHPASLGGGFRVLAEIPPHGL